MRVLRPEMAAWLLVVPPAVICWWAHRRYKWIQRRRSAPVREVARLSRRSGRLRDVAVLLCGVLALACAAIALMRPQVRAERRTPTYEKRDLVLVLDRSVSMRARDIMPSRFARAVDEIQNFLRRKPDSIDRVALVGFAGTSIVLSYPTEDLESVFFYLDWVRDDPTPLFGTDIGVALETALAVSKREAQRVPPIFVIVSDGDDQGETMERSAALVSRAGIRIHAVGIGSDNPVPMPLPTADGREEYLKDEEGRVLKTRFDESSLQRVTALTGGRYFRSSTGGELLRALQQIAAETRRQTGWTSTTEFRDLYLLFLAAAGAATVGFVTFL